jgi:hypothetical protein
MSDGALEARREAAWQQYRDSIPIRRVIQKPESGDIRLAFEAGYGAAAIRDFGPFEDLVRDWRAKAQEIRDSGDAGPIMLAVAEELLTRSDDIEHAIGEARGA